MSTDLIRYDLLVQEALKGVVRRVLTDAAREGLPGEHHFYVSFRTDHAGVRLSPRLREKYPQDMTIVLQHQFDGLTVNDQGFEVGLSFSGVPERLRVPFDSLSGFFDPSVQFGLKFETSEPGQDAVGAEETTGEAARPIPLSPPKAAPAGKGSVPKLAGKKSDGSKGSGREKPAPKEVEKADPPASAEVVSLDSFRRKS